MPKESPTASSLRAGPANPGSRAGWAPPNPPGPWWGLCSPAPSPRDPRTPVSPSPGLAGSCGQGLGTGAARAAVGRGDGGTMPPCWGCAFWWHRGRPQGAAGCCGGPCHCKHPAQHPGAAPGARRRRAPNPKPTRAQGPPRSWGCPGGGGRGAAVAGGARGDSGEVWGSQSLAGRQHFGFSWGFHLGMPGDPRQAVPPPRTPFPCPIHSIGKETQDGCCGWPQGPDPAQGCATLSPVSPSCPAAPGVFPSPVAVPGPRGTSLCQHPVPQSHQKQGLGHTRPSPTHVPAPVWGKKKTRKHPVRASPAATTAAVLPAPLFFGNITR